MANWATLKAAIVNVIKTNGNKEITGQLLQNVLNNIVSSVGENSTFVGIATPTTNPGTPDGPVFYLASTPGVYPNFNGIEVGDSETVLLHWNNSNWTKRKAGFVNQTAFDNIEEAIAKEGTVVEFSHTDGYFWNGTTSGENSAWMYTDRISVKAGDLIKVIGRGGSNGRLVFYYSNNDKLLFTAAANVRCCICCISEDGYIICNSTIAVGLSIYKLSDHGALYQLSHSSFIANLYKDFCGMVNVVPTLDTASKTFTIPKGARFSGIGVDFSTSEDIVISPETHEGISTWGTHFVIINSLTREARIVKTSEKTYINSNEVLVALVRWSECIMEANFSGYYLDGELIEFKPKSISVSRLTKTKIQDCAIGYFAVSSYSVGDIVAGELSPLSWPEETATYKYLKVIAGKASTIKIRGLGGSGSSRLYMIVDRATKLVTHIAEAGENTLFTPISIPIENESDVYITFTNASANHNVSISYADYIVTLAQLSATAAAAAAAAAVFKDYAEVVSQKPILDTAAKTLTFPKDSAIISTSTKGFNHINLTKDVVFAQADTSLYGTAFCVLNAKTQEHRTVNANASVVLTENEVVLAMVRWQECVYQANFSEYYLDDELIAFKPKTKVSTDVTAPHMFNPILNLQKTQLRVLDIGNSYTDDSTHYIPEIVSASGVDVSDMCLYKATRSGASFKNWYDIYHDQGTLSYSISRVVGGLSADISGTAAAGNGEKFRNTLANNEWDLIIIHQASTYAPYYDRWEENSSAGYLSKFIRLLRKHQPKATIGFLLVHSYWGGYNGNTEKSSLQRWKLIAESAKKLRANYGIDFIIPYGTAIQNLRASSLNNEYDLTADGTHCANGLADYTAACAYYQALFAPRYGVSILGNTARITVSPTETYPSSDISVTDENAPVAQKAAFLASYNWYDCINPDDIDDEDLI